MGFETVTTFRYTGQPSHGKAMLYIRLGSTTTLVATDYWARRPTLSLVLHPQHLPDRVVAARLSLLEELQAKIKKPSAPFDIEGILAHLPSGLSVGDNGVEVILRYGNWAQHSRRVTFNGRVTHLIPA